MTAQANLKGELMKDWVLENYRVKCTSECSGGGSCNAPLLRAVHKYSTGGYTGELEVCRPEFELRRSYLKSATIAEVLVPSEDGIVLGSRSYGTTELKCPKCGAHHQFSSDEIHTILKSIQATIERYQSGVESPALR